MKQKSYSASAVKFAFWFSEFRKVISLLAEGRSQDEIKRLCLEENALGASSAARAKRIYLTVTERINELDSSIYSLFATSDLATQKLIDLTAIMASDTLFFEFMYEVFKEKLLVGARELSDLDYRIFFRNKQLQDNNVSTWTDQTIQRLTRTYKSYLQEAGLTGDGKRSRKILKPILDPAFQDWLTHNNMKAILSALTGA
ncbi:MAG: DUF1819 family protein [Lachnospiraceae bacterium]|nr:DUF1819 family protein [Lachnospiraceae bacterium]